MPGNLQVLIEVTDWKGIDNLTVDEVLKPGYFRTFQNFHIDNDGMVYSRVGTKRQILSGTWHSIWGNGSVLYGVRNGDLVMVDPKAGTASTILSDVGPSRMNFVKVLERIFFSNLSVVGYIDDGVAYGFPDPRPQRQRMVGGSLIEFYNSCLYAVQGNTVIRSVARNPMEMDIKHNFGVLNGPITMFSAVKDGIYIGLKDHVAFAPGPDIFAGYFRVLPFPALPGSAVSIEDSGPEALNRIVYFHTPFGVYEGKPGGQVRSITGSHYGAKGATRGTASIMRPHGYWQFIYMAEVGAGISGGSTLPAITGTN